MLLWLANMGNAGGDGSVEPTPDPEYDPAPSERGLGGASGSWPTKDQYRRKKNLKEAIRDDEELMEIIKAALPHILSKYLK